MKNVKFKTIIGILFSILIFYFIYNYLNHNWQALEFKSIKISWQYLTLAFFLSLIDFFIYSYGWYNLLSREEINKSFSKINLELTKGNLGKYLPGRVWQFMGRIYLFNRIGYGKSRLLFLSFLEQYYIMLSSAFLFTLALIFTDTSKFQIQFPVNIKMILTFAVLILLFFIHPLGLSIINRILVKITKKVYLEFKISLTKSIQVFLIYFAYWIIQGSMLLCLVNGFTDFRVELIFYILGINAIAYIIGYISIITPAGLGIREGTLTFFLDIFLTKGLGAIIAILERIILVLAEILYFFIAYFIAKTNRKLFNKKLKFRDI